MLIAVLLVLLNTYPISTSRDLAFTSKQSSMENQASVVAASLAEIGVLSEGEVGKAMSLLEDMNLTRLIVTDPDMRILYDTYDAENNVGKYALFSEIKRALSGKDVFYSVFQNGVFMSKYAMPIRSSNMTVGCVYIYEYDEKQGSLLLGIQSNLIKISYIMGAISVLLVIFFTRMMTGRIGKVLGAMEIVRKGGYGYKLDVTGHDELAELGNEFNRLTQRIKTNDEMRRRFVSDASHELKTPLAAIKLLSDSIVQNENMDTDTMREFVGDIGREADRLAKITEKLLNLTRLEVMTDVPVYRVDMKAVVERALQMLLPLAENSGVSLEYQLNDGCYVKATEDDLHQIVFNLIENAIKYTPFGGKVTALLYDKEGSILFIVDDTGVGIPEADMPYIFDRFYRVDKARSRQAGGSGLGLSIVKDTVERHKGTVEVSARESGGTRFSVSFPYFDGRAEAKP